MSQGDIIQAVIAKLEYIKKKGYKPGAIVVSPDVMYEIKNYYYSSDTDVVGQFFPYFSQVQDKTYDKLFGLPISVISVSDNNKEYIEVYSDSR